MTKAARIQSREDAFLVLNQNCVIDPVTGCWNWTGSIDANGYGNLYWPASPKRVYKAHRVAYTAFRGHPGDLHVLHKCDNPVCCNAAHMFLGSNKDNVQDKMNKGRQLKGEQIVQAKLDEEDVLDIRKLHADGFSIGEILSVYTDVNRGTISRVINRRQWKHVD